MKEKENLKILALDVEGTIITSYDYNEELPNGKFPAVIDKSLKDILKKFHNAGFKIVLATGTDGDNLEYYRNEFDKSGFSQYIDEYSPENHSATDSKHDKLRKYSQQFNVSDKNIYFFDDSKNNVNGAIDAGFNNSKQVSDENTLVHQLEELYKNLVEDKSLEATGENKDIIENHSDDSYENFSSEDNEQKNGVNSNENDDLHSNTQSMSEEDSGLFINPENDDLPDDFVPGDWDVENATELFRQVKLALRNIETHMDTPMDLGDLLTDLRKETDKHLSKIKEKDAEILYKALSAAYGRIKNLDGNDEAYQDILQEISEKIKDTPGLRIIGYILAGILAVALLAAAAIVIAALMNPAGLVLGVSSAAILTTISSIFAQLTAFIASVATSVSSFFATTFGLGTGASVVIAAATDTTAGIIAASTGGVAGLLGATGVGFFAKRDIDENKSMKKVEDIMKNIGREVEPQDREEREIFNNN